MPHCSMYVNGLVSGRSATVGGRVMRRCVSWRNELIGIDRESTTTEGLRRVTLLTMYDQDGS